MTYQTEYPRPLLQGVTILGGALAALLAAFAPAHSIAPVGVGGAFLLSWIAVHFLWGFSVLVRPGGRALQWADLAPAAEGLFFYGLFLFLFSYIFALNANMDYVQRFVESGGNLQIAMDTATERRIAMVRYLPLLAVDLALWVGAGVQRREKRRVLRWSPVLVLLSTGLSVLAMPHATNLQGYGWLGWISLVPLFLVIFSQMEYRRPGRAIWYGVLYGVLFTLLGNFWLGTFNLVSLQAVGIIFLGFYGVLMPLLTFGLHAAPGRVRPVMIPLGWTAWELLRSSGFLGYPWLLVGHSQYRVIPLIQIAEVGGVWLVSFVVLLVNSLLAEALMRHFSRHHSSRTGGSPVVPVVAAVLVPLIAVAAGGALMIRTWPMGESVRLSLIQQNTDPRKHEYRDTLNALISLTEEALHEDPDLVVWSETAFVPNIRRWSQEDPRRYSLARLVQEFTAWQETIGTWLLTGNDDYARVMDDEGHEVERHSFNAAVLLDDRGGRRETYHKIKLVPFTEHFPFEEQLPWIYNMLLDFDVAFWTPGTERVIFHHPQFRFATPICFEDVFPREVRAFAREGMEVIVNISNDYWSLQETAAQQHFVASLFRTVELRRPMVRSTASGVTAHVDPWGRILATVPQYSEQVLTVDVPVPDLAARRRAPLYERWGDWVPWTAGILFFLFSLGGLAVSRRHASAVVHGVPPGVITSGERASAASAGGKHPEGHMSPPGDSEGAGTGR